jgi:hypothetical protein
MNNIRLQIGGIGILFRHKDYQLQENVRGEESHSKHFMFPGNHNDLIIDLKIGNPPLYSRRHKLFEARENWRLFGDRRRYIFETFQSNEDSGAVNRVCILQKKGLSRGAVYSFPQRESDLHCKGWSLEQFMKILGHILVVTIIHRHQGVLIHSSGIILNGKGKIFCGVSGAGKTTLARLWEYRPGVTVLSDDRVIVRKEGNAYFLYGTPWPGEGGMASSRKAPLDKIYFLFKDKENTLTSLDRKKGLHQIVTQCFPALWDRESLDFAMGFCGELLRDIPSFRFGFVPDESAVEFIENRDHDD